jgi:DNA polymerase-1
MRAEFSRVVGWQNEVRELGENGVLLDNGFGRKLRVDPERAYTQAPAMYGQSTTRDLIAEGLLTLAATAPEILPMLRVIVHDEVVLSVPRKDREEIARTVQSAMSRMWAPAGASIPVSITAGQGKPFVFGDRWGSLYQ